MPAPARALQSAGLKNSVAGKLPQKENARPPGLELSPLVGGLETAAPCIAPETPLPIQRSAFASTHFPVQRKRAEKNSSASSKLN